MEKTKRNVLKRSLFAIAMTLLMATAFLLVACGKKEYGSFIQDELLVSIGEEINIDDYFAKRGERVITYTSGDQGIFAFEDNSWKGISSGSTIVYAGCDGKVVDYINIFVKSGFAVPSNIEVSETGLITWNKSFVILEGNQVDANYEIIINDDYPVGVSTNSYQLETEGVYEVQIKAVGVERIDGSGYSPVVTLYYNAAERAEGLSFTANASGENGGILSWTEVEGVDYEILIDEILYASIPHTALRKDQKEIDLSNLASGRSVNIVIKTKDSTGNKRESLSEVLVVEKLVTPTITFNQGNITWGAITGADRYLVKYSYQDGGETISDYFESTQTTTTIPNAPSGKSYTFSVQALAASGKANSNVAVYSQPVLKLGYGSMSAVTNGNNVTFTIASSDSNVIKYRVLKDDVEINVSNWELIESNGIYTRTGVVEILGEGTSSNFTFQTIPSEMASGAILASDIKQGVIVYKLSKISSIEHSIVEGVSYLTFGKVLNATKYIANVKGWNGSEWIDVSTIENTDVTERISINLGILDTDTYSKFKIIVVADRVAEEGKVTISSTSDEKILTVLINPVMAGIGGDKLGSEDDGTNAYSWDGISNSSANYEYKLYGTTDLVTPAREGVTNGVFVDEITYGHYKLCVRSVSTDINNYLDSPSYSEDAFYVSKQLEATEIVIKYGDLGAGEGYYVDMSKVSNASKYDIYINDNVVQTISNISENVTSVKNMLGNLATEGDYIIRVKVRASDENILTESNESNRITITRLSAPTVESLIENFDTDNVDEDKKLNPISEIVKFSKPEGATSLEFGNGTAYDEENGCDLFTFDNGTTLTISSLGLKTSDQGFIDGLNGQIYLQSTFASFAFVRTSIPTELKYYNGIISFNHTGRADKYDLSLSLNTINTTEPILIREKRTETSINLDNYENIYGNLDNIVSFTMSVSAKIEEVETQQNGNTYYLSSRQSPTPTTVGRLTQAVITYSETNRQISWTSLGENIIYEIYKNGEKVAERNNPYYETGILPAGETEFYVIAKGNNMLSSRKSNVIKLHQLETIRSVVISYTNNINNTVGDYFATFKVNENASNIEQIMVNGVDVKNSMDVEGKVAINIAERIEEGQLVIEMTGASTIVDAITNITTYYIGSQRTFVLSQISGVSVSNVIDNNKFSWSTLYAPQSPSKIAYEIEVYKATQENGIGDFVKSTVVTTTEIDLNDDFFTGLDVGKYKIQLNIIAAGYTTASEGIYGKQNVASGVDFNKLSGVGNIVASLQNLATISGETSQALNISWTEPVIKNSSNLEYDIYVGNSKIKTVTGTTTTLELAEFVVGENIISVIARGGKDIPSTTSLATAKQAQPTLEIDSEGMITLSGDNTAESYIVELATLGGALIKSFVISETDKENNTSLRTYLDDLSHDEYFGEHTIRAIAKGTTNGLFLPSEVVEQERVILNSPAWTMANKGTAIEFYSNTLGCTYTIVSINGVNSGIVLNNDNKYYTFPEGTVDGDYTFVVIASREDEGNRYIDSRNQETTISFTRLNQVGNIHIQRDSVDDTTITLSWDNPAGALLSSYVLNVKAGDLDENIEIIPVTGQNTTSITIAEIEQKLGRNLPAGLIYFSITVVGEGESTIASSLKSSFALRKLEKLTNLVATTEGILSWVDDGNETISRYILSGDIIPKSIEVSAVRKVDGTQRYNVPLTSGIYNLGLRKAGDVTDTKQIIGESVFLLDSDEALYTTEIPNRITFPEQKFDFTNGTITLNNLTISSSLNLFVIYNGVSINVTGLANITETIAKLRVADIIEIIYKTVTSFSSDPEPELVFYATLNDGLKGKNSETVTIPSWSKIDTLSIDKGDEDEDKDNLNQYEDYLIHTLNAPATGRSLTIRIKHEDVYKYITFNSTNNPVGELNGKTISSILDQARFDDVYGIYTLSTSVAAYVQQEGVAEYHQTYWTDPITVSRLQPVTIINNLGVLNWTDNNANSFGYSFKATAREDSSSVEEVIIKGESINKPLQYKNYEIAMSSLSKDKGIIRSATTLFNNESAGNLVRKANLATDLTIAEGDLYLEWAEADDWQESSSFTQMLSQSTNLLTILKWYYSKAMGSNPIAISANELSNLSNVQFTTPFSFRLEDLNNLKLQMKFININTLQEYELTISAKVLLRSLKEIFVSEGISYFAVLENLAGKANNVKITAFKDMFNDDKLFTGIANEALLFDDIGNYGAESITAGTYNIYLKQEYVANNARVLSSGYLEKQTGVVVQASPNIGVAEAVNGYDKIYYLDFGTIGEVTQYKLVMYNNDNRYVFDINTEGKTISRGGVSIALLSSGEVSKPWRIPLNSRGDTRGLDDLSEDLYGKSLLSSVFAVGQGTTKILNSKSQHYQVHFLDFNAETLNVQYGKLTWDPYYYNGARKTIRIEYFYENNDDALVVTTTGNSFSPAEVSATMSKDYNAGDYSYIKITTIGQLPKEETNYDVYVDSVIYKIISKENQGIFSCYNPVLSVKEGDIDIRRPQGNPSGTRYQYRINNNINTDRYFISEAVSGDYLYKVGISQYQGSDPDSILIKESERDASSYYIYNIGTRQLNDFTIGSLSAGIREVTATQGIYFESKASTISAEMLQAPIDLTINNAGQLTWAAVDGANLKEGESIRYSVQVERYATSLNAEGNQVTELRDTEIISTSNNFIDYSRYLDETRDYLYKFSVRAMPSVENQKYANDTIFVLGSEVNHLPVNSSAPMTRLRSVTDLNVASGKVTWRSNEEGAIFEVKYTQGGSEYILEGTSEKINGVYIFTLAEENEGNANIPRMENGTISVRVFKAGSVPSREVLLPSVYKLNDIADSDFVVSDDIIVGKAVQKVTLSNYYERLYKLNGRQDYCLVDVIYNGVELFTLSQNKPTFYIKEIDSGDVANGRVSGEYELINNQYDLIYFDTDTSLELVFKVRSNEVNIGEASILNGRSFTKIFTRADINSITSLLWNVDTSSFDWETSGDGLSFDVSIETNYLKLGLNYVEKRTYRSITRKTISPSLMGTITEFKLRVRNGPANLPSEWMTYNGEGVVLDTFAGGDGTPNSPYLISSAKNFKNVSTKLSKDLATSTYVVVTKRGSTIIKNETVTESNTRYYFKQESDIVLGSLESRESDIIISGDFDGIYDANNKSISVYATDYMPVGEETANMQTVEIPLLTGGTSTIRDYYNYGFAIFENVLNGAEVKNLKINLNYQKTNRNSLIISGLTIVNSGELNNIIITGFIVDGLILEGSNNYKALIVGLAGVNSSGRILDSSLEANVSLECGNANDVYFAGIVAYNNSGELINCSNSGNVSLTCTRNGQSSTFQAGGICLTNNGRISWCSNNGQILVSSRASSYAAGLSVFNTRNSNMQYSYNDGDISSQGLNQSSTYIGGIGVFFAQNSQLSKIVVLGSLNNGNKTSSKLLAQEHAGIIASDIYWTPEFVDEDPPEGIVIIEDFSFVTTEYRMDIDITNQTEYSAIISKT